MERKRQNFLKQQIKCEPLDVWEECMVLDLYVTTQERADDSEGCGQVALEKDGNEGM